MHEGNMEPDESLPQPEDQRQGPPVHGCPLQTSHGVRDALPMKDSLTDVQV